MLRSRLFAILLLALAAHGVARADPRIPELAAYSQRIDAAAHALVADIRPRLDAHSAEIVGAISIEAPASWETNAVAERGLYGRRVVFNAGLLAVTDWLTLAMISEKRGHEGCFREYSNYLIHIAGRNSRRLKRNKDHHPMSSFAEYAAASKSYCAGAHLSVATDESVGIRDRILDGIVATVLLHEIAHHVLDHLGAKKSNLIQERMREIAADQWAIRTAVDADYDLRAAVPLFLFLAASGGGTIEDDVRSSHPSGLRRVRDLLVQTRALLDEKDPANARRMDVSIAELNRAL